MPSRESAEIRKSIVRDCVPVGLSIQEERRQWEDHASTSKPAPGTALRAEAIADVPCLWVEDVAGEYHEVVLYVHGGGLIAGSPRTHSEYASRLAQRLGRRVLLVDYRLAPEHPFPAALGDVSAVYRALLARVPSADIVFGAESSGAALALSTLVQLRDQARPLPRAAFFVSSHFDMSLSGESMVSRADVDPFTCREALERASAWYTNGADRRLPLISPLFADLSGLPPMLLQVGDDEILLSDSLRVAEEVRRRGGHAELKIWEGMWHNWPMYAELPEADLALAEIARFLA